MNFNKIYNLVKENALYVLVFISVMVSFLDYYSYRQEINKLKTNSCAYDNYVKREIFIHQKAKKPFTAAEVYNLLEPIYDRVIQNNKSLVEKLPFSEKDLKILWTAQVINETGYLIGSNNYTYYNLLGIKKLPEYPSFAKYTDEYYSGKKTQSLEYFAVFFSYEDNFEIWLDKIFNHPYYVQSVEGSEDYEEFVMNFTTVWATNPNYGKIILKLSKKIKRELVSETFFKEK